jgi:diadenosine tetraphosphatase ApaH/serine/threonine PP2A family protein phosphatase
MSSVAFAVFGDVHGNWPALEAVWAELDRLGVRHRLCLGDLVGYGADSAKCVEWIMETGIPCVQGNHDHYVATGVIPSFIKEETAATLRHACSNLTSHQRDFLANLPVGLEFEGFEAVHASLPNPTEWRYICSDADAEKHLAAQTHAVSFVGHTHRASVYGLGDASFHPSASAELPIRGYTKVLVNPGAVGQPRDRDPRACYALFDVNRQSVAFCRVEYDVGMAASACDNVGFHPVLGQRLRIGI